jgi:hypothetical protein
MARAKTAKGRTTRATKIHNYGAITRSNKGKHAEQTHLNQLTC